MCACVCVYVYVYIYTHIHIYIEREREYMCTHLLKELPFRVAQFARDPSNLVLVLGQKIDDI